MKHKILLSILILSVIQFNSFAQTEKEYGNNIISISPFGGYASENIQELTVGFAYERLISDNIGLKLPLSIGLEDTFIQTGLSVKIYVSDHKGAVKYAVAPSILYSSETRKDNDTYYFNGYSDEETVSSNQFGFYILNSLNAAINNNFYIGLEGGPGLNYINKRKVRQGTYENDGPSLGILFTAHLGYRF